MKESYKNTAIAIVMTLVITISGSIMVAKVQQGITVSKVDSIETSLALITKTAKASDREQFLLQESVLVLSTTTSNLDKHINYVLEEVNDLRLKVDSTKIDTAVLDQSVLSILAVIDKLTSITDTLNNSVIRLEEKARIGDDNALHRRSSE